MRTEIKRILTAPYIFLLIFQVFSCLLLGFVLDLVDFNTRKEKKYPGIDLKEFR